MVLIRLLFPCAPGSDTGLGQLDLHVVSQADNEAEQPVVENPSRRPLISSKTLSSRLPSSLAASSWVRRPRCTLHSFRGKLGFRHIFAALTIPGRQRHCRCRRGRCCHGS